MSHTTSLRSRTAWWVAVCCCAAIAVPCGVFFANTFRAGATRVSQTDIDQAFTEYDAAVATVFDAMNEDAPNAAPPTGDLNRRQTANVETITADHQWLRQYFAQSGHTEGIHGGAKLVRVLDVDANSFDFQVGIVHHFIVTDDSDGANVVGSSTDFFDVTAVRSGDGFLFQPAEYSNLPMDHDPNEYDGPSLAEMGVQPASAEPPPQPSS